MSMELDDAEQRMYELGRNVGVKALYRKNYLVTLEHGEDGWIIAKCPAVNAVTQGKTIGEIEKNIVEAIEVSLDDEGKEFSISLRPLYQ